MVPELFCVFDSVFESAVVDVPSAVPLFPLVIVVGGGEPFAGVSLGVAGGGCVCAVGRGLAGCGIGSSSPAVEITRRNRIS